LSHQDDGLNVLTGPARLLWLTGIYCAGACLGGASTAAETNIQPAPVAEKSIARKRLPLDRSGLTKVGNASFYAKHLVGKRMADGKPMQPHANNAASKTLPLGTTAEVKNLKTGQKALITIQDRGPYVNDRIVDLSPATANEIGLDATEGVAKVEVTPITLPAKSAAGKP
jgi:rare lipoprotein A